MMNLSRYLASRLREVYLEGTWVANTNYKMQLSQITKDIAHQKVGDLNSIAQITYHINYYLKGLIKVLNGGELDISDKYSYDMSPIYSNEDWQNLVNDLLSNADIFITKVEGMDEDRLWKPFVNEKYGNYIRNIECVIEHSYYHLGQIVIIKKQLNNR